MLRLHITCREALPGPPCTRGPGRRSRSGEEESGHRVGRSSGLSLTSRRSCPALEQVRSVSVNMKMRKRTEERISISIKKKRQVIRK